MSGLDKCETCEIDIARIRAQERTYVEIIMHLPILYGLPPGIVVDAKSTSIYYCDTCWQQQQSRMFG